MNLLWLMNIGRIAGKVGPIEAWEKYLIYANKMGIQIPDMCQNYHPKYLEHDVELYTKVLGSSGKTFEDI